MVNAILFTILVTIARLVLANFEGFTFRYWGDFEFIVFLAIVNHLYLKLSPIGLVKFYTLAFAVRHLVRMASPSKIEDVPEDKRPKDVVFRFKRCVQCSNLYDATQLTSFVVFSFLIVLYRDRLKQLLQ